jgi:hypothetical protein
MGYNVYITRQKHWADSEPSNFISLEEWKEVVGTDPEMRLDNFAETVANNGEAIRIEREGLSVWTSFPGDGIDGNHAWFDFYNGNIVVKNPTDEIIEKMISLAATLQAEVVGEDGGYYLWKEERKAELNEEKSEEIQEEIKAATNKKEKKAWWKIWQEKK